MKTYYTTLRVDQSDELLHFSLEADDIMKAAKQIACYCKGRFEASGLGAEVLDLSTSKSRGIMYRGL